MAPAFLATSFPEPMTEASEFYREVLDAMIASRLPFLVGGGYALTHFTEIARRGRDLDLFIAESERERILAMLERAGFCTDVPFPHWLAKVQRNGSYVDLIYNSGNGVAIVDDEWFQNAASGQVLGRAVRLCPVEETIWSKAFVMERERYDGADIAHLLRACAAGMDWERLLRRFGSHWRVLLSHLTLFAYIYPAEASLVPEWVVDELLLRSRLELWAVPQLSGGALCRGTLLSREQFLLDVEALGYRDARLEPEGAMSEAEISAWTAPVRDTETCG